MVQKSGVHQLRLVVYPILYRVLAPSNRWLALGFVSTININISHGFPLVPWLLPTTKTLNKTVSNLQAFGSFSTEPWLSQMLHVFNIYLHFHGWCLWCHVGKYTIHGAYGYWRKVFFFWANFPIIPKPSFLWIWGGFPILKHHLGWPTGL